MNETPNTELGARLRKLRRAADITQAALSRRMQLSGHASIYAQTIVKIESGSRSLTFLEGLAMADILGIDPRDMATDSDAEPRPEPVDPVPGIERAIEVLRASLEELRA